MQKTSSRYKVISRMTAYEEQEGGFTLTTHAVLPGASRRSSYWLSLHKIGSTRQSSLVKDSADNDAVSVRLIEDDMFTLLEASDARIDQITWPTQTGRLSKQLETLCKFADVL